MRTARDPICNVRRDVRHIIWMSAFSSAGLLMLLADAFAH